MITNKLFFDESFMHARARDSTKSTKGFFSILLHCGAQPVRNNFDLVTFMVYLKIDYKLINQQAIAREILCSIQV